MALLSNQGRAAFRSLKPPRHGNTLSHDTGDCGYQYNDGVTITNTSLATATAMQETFGVVAFHMRTWRRFEREGFPAR